MSSTGRHRVGDTLLTCHRREHDAYYTPDWCVKRLVRVLGWYLPGGARNALEPAAGSGAIVKGISLHSESGFVREWRAMEIREECREELAQWVHPLAITIGDYLAPHDRRGYDLIVSNPPYKKALEFVQQALLDTRDNGVVAMLLRLNFLAGQARANWLAGHMPDAVHVLDKRPSFTGKGTDSCEYAWMVWRVLPGGRHFNRTSTTSILREKGANEY